MGCFYLGYTSNTSSLFTYNKRIGQNWESFYDPDYVPLLSFNTNDPVLGSVCDNDMFCMFDVASTGNTEIGLSTLNSSKEYEVLLELSYPSMYVIYIYIYIVIN